MTTLVIGDIHGCYAELQELLDKAGVGASDLILAVGDIVDRGPESPEVIDFFHRHSNASSLMGNHERKHVRAARGEVQLSLAQRISQYQLGDRYPHEIKWMSSLLLFSQMQEALVVHGFFEPKVPITKQLPSVLCGTLGGAKILRERYPRPWYELYDSDRPIIVGHQNYTDSDQPFIYKDKVFGLDTSCVVGKSLTGLLLPSFRIVSVPSRGNLWERLKQEYRLANRLNAARTVDSWTEEDDAALQELIEKVIAVNQAILAKLRRSPRYIRLTSRQQAKDYAGLAGEGPGLALLQMARLGKLDHQSARRAVRSAAQIPEIALQLDELT